MSQITGEPNVPLRFLYDLRRHILTYYQAAQSEAEILHTSAAAIRRVASRVYCGAGRDKWTEAQREILDRYLDYEMRSQNAEDQSAQYRDAYFYVRDLKPSDIVFEHPDLANIVPKYLSFWQMQWIREQRKIAHGFGWELTFARPQTEVVEAFDESSKPDFNADNGLVFEEANEEEANADLGKHEVYAALENQPEEALDDFEWMNEAEPTFDVVELETLIEQSPQRVLFETVAIEYLKPAELVGIGLVEMAHIRQQLFDVFQWAQRNVVTDEKRIRQEIDDLLDETRLRNETLYPPPLQRHGSGYGQFMRAQIEYEGGTNESNWNPIDAV